MASEIIMRTLNETARPQPWLAREAVETDAAAWRRTRGLPVSYLLDRGPGG